MLDNLVNYIKSFFQDSPKELSSALKIDGNVDYSTIDFDTLNEVSNNEIVIEENSSDEIDESDNIYDYLVY